MTANTKIADKDTAKSDKKGPEINKNGKKIRNILKIFLNLI